MALIGFLLATVGLGVAAAEVRSFPLGQWGSLSLDLPEGWNVREQGPEAEGGAAIVVSPPSDIPLVLLLTPSPVPGDLDAALALAQRSVQEGAGRLQEVAVEHAVPVKPLRGPQCTAMYVSATDRTVEVPTLEDFQYIDQGVAIVGRLLVTFRQLTNLKDASERGQGLGIVRTARHDPPGPPWRTPEGKVRLEFPGKTWRVALDLPGFEMEPAQLAADHKGVRLAGENPETKMILTVFLEESPKGWTAVKHRDRYWKRIRSKMGIDRRQAIRSERGPLALLEFVLPLPSDTSVNWKSLHAFLDHDGLWLDVHLSKGGFQPRDQAFFDQIVASIRVVD